MILDSLDFETKTLVMRLDDCYIYSEFSVSLSQAKEATDEGLSLITKLINMPINKNILPFNVDQIKGHFLGQFDWFARLRHVLRYPAEDVFKFAEIKAETLSRQFDEHTLRCLIPGRYINQYCTKESKQNKVNQDIHYLYQGAINEIYKHRDNPIALKHVITLCNWNIDLIMNNDYFFAIETSIPGFIIDRGMPHIEAFYKLCNIYEKQGKLKEAIEVCDKAIEKKIPVKMDYNYYTKKKEKLLKRLI